MTATSGVCSELARNLLDNAIRHAREKVSISSRRSGRLCEIVVDDDGDGIPQQDRERIFERFYRRAHDGTGTGLGLCDRALDRARA